MCIECYDVSYFGGINIVVLMVVFEDGLLFKNLYWKFLIKEYADDFEFILQVLWWWLACFLEDEADLADEFTMKKCFVY